MNIYNDANDVHTSNRSHCGCNFQIILVSIYFFFTCFYSTLSDFEAPYGEKNLQRRIKLKAIKFTMFYVHRIVLKKNCFDLVVKNCMSQKASTELEKKNVLIHKFISKCVF
ncbi:hypothetical protein AB205_0078110 [Aquarana catesbeiana]|uniref:Uncharacterized protein n=1 Tax=Aquarana catesbeiana TaxID=8400 RepID=A0A2G9S7Z5_AQUCT|nr:hypothetical protein AB205_0078110 [Aquarana catesbeiana]